MTFNNSNIHFILLAAGNSTRFSSKNNKLLNIFKNKSILEHNLEVIEKLNFSKVTLVVNDLKLPKYFIKRDIEIIKGGKTRTLSVKNAIFKTKFKSKNIIIHDCARFISSEKLINKILKLISNNVYDCIVPYSNCSDTILDRDKDLNRRNIKLIKTPQAFKRSQLVKLHQLNKNINLNDDSQLFRDNKKYFKIKYLQDKYINLKITYKEDLESLNIISNNEVRTGIGYDIHRITKQEKKNNIFLGGAKILTNIKIISHSDGDVILHAITDSILGALSLRDIGTYFPNNKKNFNRNSKDFLELALNKMSKRNYKINNIDIMIVSEQPKINPHYKIIVENLCKILNLKSNQITIKATTNEKSGLIGKSKFIACWSNISLYNN